MATEPSWRTKLAKSAIRRAIKLQGEGKYDRAREAMLFVSKMLEEEVEDYEVAKRLGHVRDEAPELDADAVHVR